MALTKEDVLKLAELSRLEVSDQEAESTVKNLDAILGYVERLRAIDTAGVEPSGLLPRAEGWREDVAFPSDDVTREILLANFPARKGNLLHTPGVFERPKK
jgi:aspartyl-tRNA(Asn)/glutamyl-tRNA(Gln) amidotransferase subunit C